jgi:hypothetical protein
MLGPLLARLGKMHAGLAPGQFTSPHGMAVDGHGNTYVEGGDWPSGGGIGDNG